MFTIQTPFKIDEASMHIQSVMGKHHWVLAHKDSNSLTFNKTKKPNILLLIVLLLLWVLPGILYLVFGWGKQTASFMFRKEGNKTVVTMYAGIMTATYGRKIAKELQGVILDKGKGDVVKELVFAGVGGFIIAAVLAVAFPQTQWIATSWIFILPIIAMATWWLVRAKWLSK